MTTSQQSGPMNKRDLLQQKRDQTLLGGGQARIDAPHKKRKINSPRTSSFLI
jgi:hypothetical protein